MFRPKSACLTSWPACRRSCLDAAAQHLRRIEPIRHMVRDRSLPVIIVSNNAEEPIVQFLQAHNLYHQVAGIVARIPGRPDLMKPDPTQ